MSVNTYTSMMGFSTKTSEMSARK